MTETETTTVTPSSPPAQKTVDPEKRQKQLEGLAKARAVRAEKVAKRREEKKNSLKDKLKIEPITAKPAPKQSESDGEEEEEEIQEVWFEPKPKDPKKKERKEALWQMVEETHKYITKQKMKNKQEKLQKKTVTPKQQHFKDKINNTPIINW
jgi:hypothetical protein